MAWKPGDPKPKSDDLVYPPGDAGVKAYEADESAWRAEERKKGAASAVAQAPNAGPQKSGGEWKHNPNTGRPEWVTTRVIKDSQLEEAPKADMMKTEPKAGDRPTPPPEGAGLTAQAAYQKALREWQRQQQIKALSAGTQAKAMEK